jgi:hypothetical protein
MSKGRYKDKAKIFELFYTKAYIVFYLLKSIVRALFKSYEPYIFIHPNIKKVVTTEKMTLSDESVFLPQGDENKSNQFKSINKNK